MTRFRSLAVAVEGAGARLPHGDVEEIHRLVRPREHPGLAAGMVERRQGQQHEGMVVAILGAVERQAVEAQAVKPAAVRAVPSVLFEKREGALRKLQSIVAQTDPADRKSTRLNSSH